MISRLELEGIRCFTAPQVGSVRPLTLLVGENSAGKSTFLALYQVAARLGFPSRALSPFNDPPFLLGAFEQIASNSRRGGLRSFYISYTVGDRRNHVLGSVRLTLRPVRGQPFVHSVRLEIGEVRFDVNNTPAGAKVAIRAMGGETSYLEPEQKGSDFWPYLTEAVPGLEIFSERELDLLLSFFEELGGETLALAPVRTTPQRTYDPVGSAPQPEGSHVPMLLAELAREGSSRWRTLRRDLAAFGTESGLFDDIDVLRKGEKESDPFQIAMETGGPSVNLVDVGYGVSQVLPILVDTLRLGPRSTLLLQQPEVHLHPRAQAELGTFFATRVRKGSNFIIETHSDYLVDRVRMEVREKNLKADEVSILYFERGQRGARIHNLNLDDQGNIVDAPPSYREFFLREERHLLDVE